MKKWLYSVVAVPFLLMGCGEEEAIQTDANTQAPALVEVVIQTEGQLNVGESIQLAARVSQNGEAVADADEVKFEVWESGMREDGETLQGTLTEDGVYAADFTFDHDGVYYLFAHTTARGMHVMPKQELIVGNPDMSKVLEDTSTNSMDHTNHNEQADDETDDEHDH